MYSTVFRGPHHTDWLSCNVPRMEVCSSGIDHLGILYGIDGQLLKVLIVKISFVKHRDQLLYKPREQNHHAGLRNKSVNLLNLLTP